MKIVVIGGTGLIGSKLVTKLREHGHEAVAASPSTGVNTLTGEGLAEVLAGASVVVDVSNSPSFERAAVLEFFQTSTRNLLAAEAAAGVGHHVAVSVVGTERMPENGYFRGEDRSGGADREVVDPVLARARDAVLRVRPEHRGRGHGRRQGADRARALPAHGGRRRRPGGRPGRGGIAAERQGGGRAGPSGSGWMSSSAGPGRLGRPARGGRRPAGALLRQRAGRAHAGAR